MQDTDKYLIAYVDGSYDPSQKRYAYACLFLTEDGEETLAGSGNDPEVVEMRNVTGEMIASMQAVRWAIRQGYETLEIRYDYEGIEKWVTGAWKAKKEYTRKYAEYMRACQSKLKLVFHKVRAHSGDKLNEKVDLLAKQELGKEKRQEKR